MWAIFQWFNHSMRHYGVVRCERQQHTHISQCVSKSAQKERIETTHRIINLNHTIFCLRFEIDCVVYLYVYISNRFERLQNFRSSGRRTILLSKTVFFVSFLVCFLSFGVLTFVFMQTHQLYLFARCHCEKSSLRSQEEKGQKKKSTDRVRRSKCVN